MEWRNARRLPSGNFEVEVNLPGIGWVPSAASALDPVTVRLHREIAGSGPVPDAPAPEATNPVLDQRQFVWLLAYTGHDDLWDGVLDYLRGHDRELYADLRAERQRLTFRLEVVRSILERPDIAAVLSAIGGTVDMAAVEAAWPLAASK